MLVTISWIESNYNKYNKLYFGGILPSIKFKISRSKKTWGYASYTYNRIRNVVTPEAITISNYFDSPEDVKLTTLLHEMIHIYDYTINPHHFVANGRKVRYDAHGYWFREEANRIKKLSGLDIQKYVTVEEESVSSLSESAKRAVKSQQETALVCAITGNCGNWIFKTNTWHVDDILNTISSINWTDINGIKKIKFYTFKDEKLAARRSCGKKLRGWKLTNEGLYKKLCAICATETRKYNSNIKKIVKLAA